MRDNRQDKTRRALTPTLSQLWERGNISPNTGRGESDAPILPGATIGVLGSGQLGRMLAIEARKMGYRVHVFSPGSDTPTGQVADLEVSGAYEDLEAIRAFVRGVDVLTFEFENIPFATVQAAAELEPVHPGGWVLHTAQNRIREKRFLREAGLPLTPFAVVRSLDELRAAVAELGCPAVLKTASFGYDGKGQAKISRPEQVEAAWQAIGEQEAVLEAFVDFECELSVVGARGLDGSFTHYGVIENIHHNHILDISLAPARVSEKVVEQAIALAKTLFEKLDVIGVLCIEFFLTKDKQLLINELAPRPHNSGHLTFDAAITSQFEQQLRAVCGLPLGETSLVRPTAMANLLGNLWQGGEPDWQALLAYPNVKLHLYGKAEARRGRKMGHLTALANSVEEAQEQVLMAREALTQR